MRRSYKIMALSLMALLLGTCAPYYQGPTSANFNGEVFVNPVEQGGRSFGEFLKWRFTRDRGPWPEHVDVKAKDLPPASVAGDRLRVSFVGHATVFMQTQGVNILTDPVWAGTAGPFGVLGASRVIDPGIDFDKLPKIDVVLISHNHYDHLDLTTLKRLHDRDGTLIVAPLGNDAIINGHDPAIRVKTLDWGQNLNFSDAITIALEPAQHWSARTPLDRNRALWGAFVIETKGGNIYYAGDTGYGGGDHFRTTRGKFGKFRLALLPIGAYAPRWFMSSSHMNPEEAAMAHLNLGADQSLAIHFATFRLTDEPFDEPVARIRAARASLNIAKSAFRVIDVGVAWEVPALPSGHAKPPPAKEEAGR